MYPNTTARKRKEKLRKGRISITGFQAVLNPIHGKPYYYLRIRAPEVAALLSELLACAEAPGRRWFAMTATHEKPERLRTSEELQTPRFEASATPNYARGEAFVIQGRGRSCNIRYSGQVGARLLAERLSQAQDAMREFVEIRIPSRSHNLIEFVADAEIAPVQTQEDTALVITGEKLAAHVLESEDFSDWEAVGA